MNTAKLLEYFEDIDTRGRGELRFDDFSRLYQKLLITPTVIISDFIYLIYFRGRFSTRVHFTNN